MVRTLADGDGYFLVAFLAGAFLAGAAALGAAFAVAAFAGAFLAAANFLTGAFLAGAAATGALVAGAAFFAATAGAFFTGMSYPSFLPQKAAFECNRNDCVTHEEVPILSPIVNYILCQTIKNIY